MESIVPNTTSLTDFFRMGVDSPPPEERTMTPTADRKKKADERYRLSNKCKCSFCNKSATLTSRWRCDTHKTRKPVFLQPDCHIFFCAFSCGGLRWLCIDCPKCKVKSKSLGTLDSICGQNSFLSCGQTNWVVSPSFRGYFPEDQLQ